VWNNGVGNLVIEIFLVQVVNVPEKGARKHPRGDHIQVPFAWTLYCAEKELINYVSFVEL
jgi:hypothetical protein